MEVHRTPLSTPDTIPQDFTLYRGWDDQLASELVQRSTDADIIKWTPRDHQERFANQEAADAWFHRVSPRVVYSLYHVSELAGVIWYSQAPRTDIPENYTMAIRLYGPARGQHLATPLLLATEEDFVQATEDVTGIWLETDVNNEAAKRSYSRAGYSEASRDDHRITMTKQSSSH